MTDQFVLVTGGAGYIGSHACKSLAKAGFVPVTFDNLSTGKLSSVKWGPFVNGDLLDTNQLKETFLTYDFVGAIHFAAKAYVEESVKNPLKYFEGNISTTINLIRALDAFDVSNLVFSSSCATYGMPNSDELSESDVQSPINPYGFSKFACERLIEYSAQIYALKYANLRYFNAAGADPEGDLGESHEPETHLIPLALQAAITNTQFKVFGGDYPTKDGSAIRDFIHVSDLATAHVRALQKLINNGQSFTCNLGSGVGYSVFEVMKEIRLLFPSFDYTVEERRIGDPPKLVADNSLSRKILDLKLDHSSLQNILKTSLKWQLTNGVPIE
jgi:UDP-arabinose 4-epimerase